MALKLIPPGTRGNLNYVARGSINGKVHEISLGTRDPKVARKALRAKELELRARGQRPTGNIIFEEAARRYVEFRDPSYEDRRRLDVIVGKIGGWVVAEIKVADLHQLANQLLPNTKASTRNRNVLRPAAVVLHYAADSGLCPPIKIKMFPEELPHTRAVAQEDAARLIEAAPAGPKRLLLLWLFHQGMRITHTLNVTWDRVDLGRGLVKHREVKGARARDWVFPLHAEVLAELRQTLPEYRVGKVFPWRHRQDVSKWLIPLRKAVGVHFTPHMARHSKGTWMNEAGAGTRTIMEALGHASVKSSIRYQHGNVEVVRAVGAKVSLRRSG